MKIVFASNNAGKTKEISALLKDFSIELILQSELGVSEIEETGLTFVENALLKARHAAKETGLPALSDDSGLVVAALNGAPGIYSARYAGKEGDAKKNIAKVLQNLNQVPAKNRAAFFCCVLTFLKSPTDPSPIICEGFWFGEILKEPIGENGFGYDPIFFDPKENLSAAQLPFDKKNRVSHRGQALQCLLARFKREKLC